MPEIDVGSKLPLTSFDVTDPGLAAVTGDTFWQSTSHLDIDLIERES